MTLFAQLNGQTPVIRARVSIPYTGIWHADVWLDRVADVAGPQTLVVNNLTLTGTVLRQIDFTGASTLRIVGGGGGWSKSVAPAFWSQPNISTVLGDVAALVGERVNVVADSQVDPFYVVLGDQPASNVLQELAGDGWWMDPMGTTQVGPRASSTIATPFTLRDVDGPPGVYHVDTDDVASWMPGAAFSAPTGGGIVSRVTHVLDGGKLRTEIMVPQSATVPTDQLRQQIEGILLAYLPCLLFFGEWNYRVVAANGGPVVTIDAQPLDPRLPPISGVPLRPDASGGTSTPAVGGLVTVGFANGDPRRPEVRSTDPSSNPTGIWLGGGVLPIARLGDQVMVFLPPTLAIVGTAIIGGMPTPIAGSIAVVNPITGIITQGSSILNGP